MTEEETTSAVKHINEAGKCLRTNLEKFKPAIINEVWTKIDEEASFLIGESNNIIGFLLNVTEEINPLLTNFDYSENIYLSKNKELVVSVLGQTAYTEIEKLFDIYVDKIITILEESSSEELNLLAEYISY